MLNSHDVHTQKNAACRKWPWTGCGHKGKNLLFYTAYWQKFKTTKQKQDFEKKNRKKCWCCCCKEVRVINSVVGELDEQSFNLFAINVVVVIKKYDEYIL